MPGTDTTSGPRRVAFVPGTDAPRRVSRLAPALVGHHPSGVCPRQGNRPAALRGGRDRGLARRRRVEPVAHHAGSRRCDRARERRARRRAPAGDDARGGVWVGWDGGIETPRAGRRPRDQLRPVSPDAGARSTPTTTASPTARSGRCCTGSSSSRPSTAPAGMPTAPSTRISQPPTTPSVAGYRGCTTTTCCCSRGCSAGAVSTGRIGFFLHVPFPPPEVFARLPWRDSCSRACSGRTSSRSTRPGTATTSSVRAGSSSTGPSPRHRRFSSPTGALSERPPTRSRSMLPISPTGRARPGVDRALAGLQKQFADRRLLLGVDRLDYTKGIPERLRAIELLLELRPDLRREITFVQVAVPSRGEIREYRELARRRRAARRPDQRPLHRAGPRRCRCTTCTAA